MGVLLFDGDKPFNRYLEFRFPRCQEIVKRFDRLLENLEKDVFNVKGRCEVTDCRKGNVITTQLGVGLSVRPTFDRHTQGLFRGVDLLYT